MKTIIAGSRHATLDFSMWAINENPGSKKITEVVCGGAKGADTWGKEWALAVGIPVKMFEADWGKYGKAAGHVRNQEMANYADALIALWDGKSPGTKNMIELAKKKGLQVDIYFFRSDK